MISVYLLLDVAVESLNVANPTDKKRRGPLCLVSEMTKSPAPG